MDTKEPQQGTTYILRPDTVVELPDTENTYNRFVRIYDRLGQYITDLDLEAFNRGFVEFDEQRTQSRISSGGCVVTRRTESRRTMNSDIQKQTQTPDFEEIYEKDPSLYSDLGQILLNFRDEYETAPTLKPISKAVDAILARVL